MLELDAFAEKCDDKYPTISKSWREKWAALSTYFKYPTEVRKIIYTTNIVEGFNRQLRRVTKNKFVFPTDDSLLKMLHFAVKHKQGLKYGNSNPYTSVFQFTQNMKRSLKNIGCDFYNHTQYYTTFFLC